MWEALKKKKPQHFNKANVLSIEINNLIIAQKKGTMSSFTLQGPNIRLLVEIQAAAENILAALVFSRKTLSVQSKTILSFKYIK